MNRSYPYLRTAILTWVTAVIVGAFLLRIPKMSILEHTARNLYFHVPMWFTMMAGMALSAFHAVGVLARPGREHDLRSATAAQTAMLFGVLGMVTGIVWARVTWYQGTDIWWNFDPRQTFAAMSLLVYAAYFVLRSQIDDIEQRARICAVYNVFAFTTVPFLLYILPRQVTSLHPGAEGNPAFSDITDPRMRLVFYPAVIGFIALFWLLYNQRVRLGRLLAAADRTSSEHDRSLAS